MLLIYVPVSSPRIDYIFKLIFEKRLGLMYSVTQDILAFSNYEKEKLNYSSGRFSDGFFIHANDILIENCIRPIDVSIAEIQNTKIIFSNFSDDVGFDIFAAVFYMLSRYEEYLPFHPDAFGRFKATDSLAYKNNFLQKPIADIWIDIFINTLQKKYPHIQYKPSGFSAMVTYDIDVAFKYKSRSLKRNAGATLKDVVRFDFKNIYNRFQTLVLNKKDPWDVYKYLCNELEQFEMPSVFFFLLGDNTKHDRNLDFKNTCIKNLVHFIQQHSNIGIHPSFTTTINEQKIKLEKQRLETIAQTKITKSRQHYLKFLLPETYQALIAAGIDEDYSMCFPEMHGFRAGTCKPYHFYNIKNETETGLTIFPAAFMDGSFIYSKTKQEEAMHTINYLIDEVISVNGTFISIWHNHTVSATKEFNGWKHVHDEMIERLATGE